MNKYVLDTEPNDQSVQLILELREDFTKLRLCWVWIFKKTIYISAQASLVTGFTSNF